MKQTTTTEEVTYKMLKELALRWAPKRFDWKEHYLEGAEKKLEQLAQEEATDLVLSIRKRFIDEGQYDRLTEIANLADELDVRYDRHYSDRRTALEERILSVRRISMTNALPYGMTETTEKKLDEIKRRDFNETQRYLDLLKQYEIKDEDIKDIADKAMELYPKLDADIFVFGHPSQEVKEKIKQYAIDGFREVFAQYLK